VVETGAELRIVNVNLVNGAVRATLGGAVQVAPHAKLVLERVRAPATRPLRVSHLSVIQAGTCALTRKVPCPLLSSAGDSARLPCGRICRRKQQQLRGRRRDRSQ
jgi:hypothetical protein